MPAPTNTSFATAINLGSSFPLNATQQVDFAGTTYRVYYQFTAPATTVVGVWCFGDLSVYQPTTQVFDQTQSWYLGIAGTNVPLQFPVTAGQVYYLQITPNGGNPSPANLTINVQTAPVTTAPIGSFLIPDDTSGFAAAILSRTDGTVLRTINGFPAGEGGDVLTDGTFLVEDVNNGQLVLYSSALTQLATIAFYPTSGNPSIRSNQSNKFYVGATGTVNGLVKRYTSAGVLEQTWTLTSSTIVGIAPSLDETKLYVTGQGGTSSPTIKVWDLVNSVFLTDLTTGVASHVAPSDLLVMNDGSIVTVYDKFTTTKDTTVVRYSSAGTLLNSTSYANATGGVKSRLTYDSSDATVFWLWLHLPTGFSRFKKIKFSDFSEQASFDIATFEGGVYQGAATATPSRFGSSTSCPFLAARKAILAPATEPQTPPSIPGTCCSPPPSSSVITSPPSSSGTSKGGVGFCTTYTGPSGVVPIATDPSDGDTLTGKRAVYTWLEMIHTDY